MQKLVITFAPKEHKNKIIQEIQSTYTLLYDTMYVFESPTIENEYLISYNVDIDDKESLYSNTMVCHRRKSSDNPPVITMFTMNGLNELKKVVGDKINWNLFDKSLIIVRDNKLIPIKINLVDKISLK